MSQEIEPLTEEQKRRVLACVAFCRDVPDYILESGRLQGDWNPDHLYSGEMSINPVEEKA